MILAKFKIQYINSSMERYFRFSDEKSDKYWEVIYSETTSTVFFGRIGSAGRVEEKKYASELECIKEVEKQISSKLKKGYKETQSTNRPVKDAETLVSIKDFEDRWDFKVSPLSKKHMNEPFFWSSIEETSPFGSDEGSDTFSFLLEGYQENPRMNPMDFLMETFQDHSIYPLTDLNCIDSDTLVATIDELEYVIMQDSAIWAITFGQLVIKGVVDKELKQIALNSLKRQTLEIFLELHGDVKRLDHIAKMGEVLHNL